MSAKGIHEALIDQKAEFLKIEIDELKKRETSLKKMNESLILAVQQFNPFQDLALEELKKVNEQHERDIESMKKRYNDKIAALEKQNHDLILQNKELKLDLKHQNFRFEGERHDLQAKIQSMETDKLTTLSSPKALISPNYQEKLSFEQEFKYNELKKNFDEEKEELRLKAQQAEESIVSLKNNYAKEIETLKVQLKSLQFKNRHQAEKIEQLKSKEKLMVNKQRADEITVQTTSETSSSMNSQDNSPKARIFKQENKSNILKSQVLNSQRDFFTCESCRILKGQIQEKEDLIKDLSNKVENEILQKEKIKVDMDKALMEIKNLKQIQVLSHEKYAETEKSLKNEIKFLIGKVLKAKSKLAVESELNDSFKRDGILNTIRSRSVNKARGTTKPPSPSLRSISPLNLSVIPTSESPILEDLDK
ncbi:unnamed protein product [Blepharisma stoltei]|uniref:Uncharacterized protein n=1 Tax=Blepharisma stoltei TaxID=1481888 RepID=A0AAU9JI27_9CILI|nr:unnamed protein product [Blepharisma stoltei]